MTEIEEFRQELRRVADKLDSVILTLSDLHRDWQEFRPVADAFKRGGVLAARAAAKAGRNSRV